MNDEGSKSSLDDIIGDTPQLKQMLQLTMKAARTDAPLLILGEAGSGKQLIARAVHRISARKHESFVTVNCVALGESSLGPHIFGEANQLEKPAQLELANKGIIYLKEIALIPHSVQTKLFRLMERREFFERVGSLHTNPVNVRLIASTKYDLAERVAEETFRGDLYEQLNVFPIRVPPLRERRDDIPLLARYFMQKFARRIDKQIESIPAETMRYLVDFEWPGNVRQLENLIQSSVVLTEGSALLVPLAALQPPERESREPSGV